jgi:hypothetical protein
MGPDLLDLCGRENITGLVHHKLAERDHDWPQDLVEELAREARTEAARELVRQRELTAVLDALAAADLRPILFKGTSLAYSVYTAPSCRSRRDTDLFVPRHQVEAVRRVMTELGYSARVGCSGELLFCQFVLEKTDRLGLHHQFDVHWKISTQSVFADLLSYDEVAAEAAPLTALGPHARGASRTHALFLACVHPAMHHRNVECLVWTYDIHLLASLLSNREFAHIVDLAFTRQVTAIVRHQLDRARSLFGTPIPRAVTTRLSLSRSPEPSAVYLRKDRRWHNELASSLTGLPRWRDRLRLLREVLLPEPSYVLRAYGIAVGSTAAIVLPFLYLHRGVYGAWKVVSGRK